MRVIRYLLVSLVALLALLVLSVFLLASRPAGFLWVLEQAIPRVPGTLEITEPSGDLLRGIRAGRLRYELPPLQVEAEGLQMRLSWPALTTGLVRFATVQAERLHITVLPTEDAEDAEADEDLPEVSLPFPLQLARAHIGEFRLQAAGLDEQLTAVQLRATMRGTRLRVDNLQARVREVQAQLRGQVQLSGDWPLRADLDWSLPNADMAISGQASANGSLTRLELLQTVTVPSIAERVRIRAVLFDLTTALRAEATADWTGLRWRLNPDTELESASGSVAFSGAPEAYSVAFDVDFRVPPLPPLELQLEATGDTGQLRLSELLLRGLKQDITGRGDLDWSSGALRGSALQLRADTSTLNVDGWLWPQPDLSFALTAPALEQLLANAAGSIEASGTVAGSIEAPAVTLNATGSGLGFDNYALQSLDARLQLASDGRLQADLTATGLVTDTTTDALTVEQLTVAGTGTLDRHEFRLAWSAAPLQGEVTARGSLDWPRWQGQLLSADLQQPLVGDWQLAAPATLSLRLPQAEQPIVLSIDAHCWDSAPAQLCAAPLQVTSQVDADIKLTDLPLDRFAALIGDSLQVTGRAEAALTLSGALAQPDATLEVQLLDGRIARPGAAADDPAAATALPEARARLNLQGKQLDYTARITADSNLRVTVDGRSDWPLAAATRLDATVTATLDDFSALAPLLLRFGGVETTGGELNASFALGGTVAEPAVSGNGELRNGGAQIAAAGIEVSDIQLTVSGRGGEPLQISGSAASGGGSLTLSGALDLLNESGVPDVVLQLQGENFQVLRFPEQQVFASPELEARWQNSQLTITGRVRVPRARIEVKELPQSAVRPSSDVVVIREAGNDEAEARESLQLISRIQVVLGNDVNFEAFGLTTGLAGSLLLQTTATNPAPTLDGNLRSVAGKFEAFGRELDIERGTLVFTGAPERPFVDVRAARSLRHEGRQVKVGVLLTGPIDNMQTRVFGEPAMNESDALSYLVLGRPMQRNDSLANEELSSAAVALGLVSLLPGTQRLGDTLGLDEVGFEGTTEATSSVVAGKRFGEDFYVRYAYGLFDRIGTFIVRYNIGRGFSLEAGSGEEQTINLLYSVDR